MSGKKRRNRYKSGSHLFKRVETSFPKRDSYPLFKSRYLNVSASVDRGRFRNVIEDFYERIEKNPVKKSLSSAQASYRRIKSPTYAVLSKVKKKL